ncbi:hypothetical protein NC652_018987 [Populus alba x Populus x berolinensis]|nr:hypothetical protein NC652_018987 [Populus alba x Populus x berolinensis]
MGLRSLCSLEDTASEQWFTWEDFQEAEAAYEKERLDCRAETCWRSMGAVLRGSYGGFNMP